MLLPEFIQGHGVPGVIFGNSFLQFRQNVHGHFAIAHAIITSLAPDNQHVEFCTV